MGSCWVSLAANLCSRATGQRTPGISTSPNATDSTNSGASNGSENSSFTILSVSNSSLQEGHISPSSNLRTFTFFELMSATKNFQADGLLGDGGFGGVYKGFIDGMVIAVKKLNAKSSEGFEEWESEVSFLGRLSHPNLVKLLGYCWERKELLLVYEYIPNGSLDTHLFGKASSVPPLSWDSRIKIAIGAAKGLSFLHITQQVIYKDFKISNLLLDKFYNAKISDFGLAKTRMSGYATPEFVSTGRIYVKNDVYGFGVVLAELLTGLRSLDPNRPGEQFSLVNWVTPSLLDRRKLRKVMDPRLQGKYPLEAALQTARLALKCLGLEPKSRPSIQEVVETLTEIQRIAHHQNRKKSVHDVPNNIQGMTIL